MKKFLVLLVVVALTLIASMAFADIKMSGEFMTRSRNFDNASDLTDQVGDHEARTQTRIRVNLDGTAGDAKAKVTLENDWDTWGRFEAPMGDGTTATSSTSGNTAFLTVREVWVDVPLFDMMHVKGGHLRAQLGNGWFFRSMKYGSDAWIAYTDIDDLHLGLVDVKIAEGNNNKSDDVDAYVLVGTYKLSDSLKAGINVTEFHARSSDAAGAFNAATSGDNVFQNIGLHATAKLGEITLNGELDMQMGKDKTDQRIGANQPKYKGKQLVVQAMMPMGPVTLDATLGYGRGEKLTTDGAGNFSDANANSNDAYVAFLDADPHYTLLYEYSVRTAANNNMFPAAPATAGRNSGFVNTTALSVGATAKVADSLTVGGSIWLLSATEKVWNPNLTNTTGLATGDLTDELGAEVDLKLNWKISDAVAWNWTAGIFKPGKAYSVRNATTGLTQDADDVQGIQGVLVVKF